MRIWLLDSVAEGGAVQTGELVVTGSHGGSSAARYALSFRPLLVVFNDAGVGKDGAGVAGLELLEREGLAAVAVDCESARIGEAADTWDSGVISHANVPAAELGFRVGERLREVAERFAERRGTR